MKLTTEVQEKSKMNSWLCCVRWIIVGNGRRKERLLAGCWQIDFLE